MSRSRNRTNSRLDVRSAMGGTAYACADDVAVLADGVLVGIVPIERLLAAGKLDRIAELMDANPPVVAPGTDLESVAWEMVRGATRASPS